MIKQFLVRLAPLALAALPLASCGSSPQSGETEHGEAAEAPEGPHGGRLLTDGDLGLEITIFETGQEPQF
ncbi:MAG TPA: HlyD family secretion protein, partial [Alteraurantiacibacter sp.]